MRPASAFPALVPGPTRWTLYHLGYDPLSSVSGGARRAPAPAPEGEDQPLPSQVDLRAGPPGGEDWLAVSGAGRVDHAAVKVLANRPDALVRRIRRVLRRRGYWRGDQPLLQNLSVDLDGDGRPDRVLVVESGTARGADLAVAARGGLRGRRLHVDVLTDRAWRAVKPIGGLYACVTAVADINSDGHREIGISIRSSDLEEYEVCSFDGTGFRPVLWSWSW